MPNKIPGSLNCPYRTNPRCRCMSCPDRCDHPNTKTFECTYEIAEFPEYCPLEKEEQGDPILCDKCIEGDLPDGNVCFEKNCQVGFIKLEKFKEKF